MKFSAQEEYGLRCLLRLARLKEKESLTIAEMARLEEMTEPNTAKILRALRMGGFITSARGQTGGYSLARPPEEIRLSAVMRRLGGRLFDEEFCDRYGGPGICTHEMDCSVKSLWVLLQEAVDQVLEDLTLADLLEDLSRYPLTRSRRSSRKALSLS
ncbi:MAG: Rrf2 family transcriptional regulator [Candidatus Hydrogenedentota bacterium]|nr:MAG: Rrf2 family transcriptional regulator [Candidatus Hydrogenedentota bacterium]